MITRDENMKPPIFIGGMYKSGTSLLRAMLSQHPNIAGGLETFWFDLDFAGVVENNASQTRKWDATRAEPLKKHIQRLAQFYEVDLGESIKLAETQSSPESFIDWFLNKYTREQKKSRWVEKTPANLLHIERIYRYWPTGFFIHITRDPRDVFTSLYHVGKWREPLVFAELWGNFFLAFQNAVQNVPDSFILQVRYEDLVLDSVGTMKEVVSFIDEKWDDKVVDYRGDSKDFEKVKKFTGKLSTTLKRLGEPLTNTRIGIYKTEPEVLKLISHIEEIIGHTGMGDMWNHYKYVS